MAEQAVARNFLDFSRAWDFSDAVLLVQGSRFHVHRSVLAMWSPVFSRMFTADFREKTANVIPLPGKKANEIEEMLLVIYPTSSKQIDESNCWFLLNLAREYMMTNLTEKCECYLMNSLENSQLPEFRFSSHQRETYYPRQRCLDLLESAQYYELESLQEACVAKAQSISFRELKSHEIYKKISPSNYRKITEGKIEQLENDAESSESDYRGFKSGAADAFRRLEAVVNRLVFLVLQRRRKEALYYNDLNSIDDKIDFLAGEMDIDLSQDLSALRSRLDQIKQ